MEAFGNALKVLIEKRLVPTIFGLFFGGLVYAITPENSRLLEKLGRNCYIIFFWTIGFLLITFVSYLVEKLSLLKIAVSNKRCNKERKKEREIEEMQVLWDHIDSLSLEDRKFIMKFLDNNNSPIIEFKNYRSFFNDLRSDTNLVKCREIVDESGCIKNQYILSESFYNALKFSMEKYGRISNFSEEE